MQTILLSDSAISLFRRHVERKGKIDVDNGNREPYRELEHAGLVLLGRPFVGEPRYHLTRSGSERKQSPLSLIFDHRHDT